MVFYSNPRSIPISYLYLHLYLCSILAEEVIIFVKLHSILEARCSILQVSRSTYPNTSCTNQTSPLQFLIAFFPLTRQQCS